MNCEIDAVNAINWIDIDIRRRKKQELDNFDPQIRKNHIILIQIVSIQSKAQFIFRETNGMFWRIVIVSEWQAIVVELHKNYGAEEELLICFTRMMLEMAFSGIYK